jgi:predicted esterase YcpF (UPF0227 family)
MIIYIHGFSGSGQGSKAKLFKEYFKDRGIIAPSLSYVPDLAMATLEELIQSYQNLNQKIFLVGSSLGGYYALYLSQKYNLKAVLLNPSIYPYETLALWKGFVINFYDESTFSWTQNHIESLKNYQPTLRSRANLLLLAQKGDELLDYKVALTFLEGCQVALDEGGSHAFEDIQKHFDTISNFLQ